MGAIGRLSADIVAGTGSSMQQCLDWPRHLQIHRWGLAGHSSGSAMSADLHRSGASYEPDIVWVMRSATFVDNGRGVYKTTDGQELEARTPHLRFRRRADLELRVRPTSLRVHVARTAQPWTIIGAREAVFTRHRCGDAGKLAGGHRAGLFGVPTPSRARRPPDLRLIEAKPGSGLYRSDVPAPWTLVNGSASLITRPLLLRHARRRSQ